MPRTVAILAALAGMLLAGTPFAAGIGKGPPLLAGPPALPPSYTAPPYAARPYVSPQATAAEAAELAFMREEEKLARDVYLRLHDAWGIAPFASIAASEQHHMDAVLRLLTRYRVADPAAGNAVGEFSDAGLQALFDALVVRGTASAAAALRVGALVEEVDLDDLAGALARTDKRDVDQVYESLACGSRNHLRAFAGALAVLTGQPYAAQHLPQAAVDAILASPVGECSAR